MPQSGQEKYYLNVANKAKALAHVLRLPKLDDGLWIMRLCPAVGDLEAAMNPKKYAFDDRRRTMCAGPDRAEYGRAVIRKVLDEIIVRHGYQAICEGGEIAQTNRLPDGSSGANATELDVREELAPEPVPEWADDLEAGAGEILGFLEDGEARSTEVERDGYRIVAFTGHLRDGEHVDIDLREVLKTENPNIIDTGTGEGERVVLYVCDAAEPKVPEPPRDELESVAARFLRNFADAGDPQGAFAARFMLRDYGGIRLDGPTLGKASVLWTLYYLWRNGNIEVAAAKDLETEIAPGKIAWEAHHRPHAASIAIERVCLRVTDEGWERWRSGASLCGSKQGNDLLQCGIVLERLLWPRAAPESVTQGFKGQPHDDLLIKLRRQLENQLTGGPQVSILQSLQDKGCDLLIDWGTQAKYGIQLKSHGDIADADFARTTLSQIQDSKQHGLQKLWVVLAGDLTDQSQRQRTRGLASRVSSMNDSYVRVVPPERAWTLVFPDSSGQI